MTVAPVTADVTAEVTATLLTADVTATPVTADVTATPVTADVTATPVTADAATADVTATPVAADVTARPVAADAATARPGRVVRPYGDTTGDGMVQLSFTLPVAHGKLADGAALQLAAKMGLDPAMVVHSHAVGPSFTFAVVYGRVRHLVDLDAVAVVERDYPLLTAREVNAAVRGLLRRRLVVVGACVGTDAHTVGIDAILNVKGIAGEKGLESYREIQVVNLGAQVPAAELATRARSAGADAVLVSQVVTQRDAHLANAMAVREALTAAYPAGHRPLLVVGGPRFDESAAADLGVDAVFGRGTTARDVAAYLVHALAQRRSAPS